MGWGADVEQCACCCSRPAQLVFAEAAAAAAEHHSLPGPPSAKCSGAPAAIRLFYWARLAYDDDKSGGAGAGQPGGSSRGPGGPLDGPAASSNRPEGPLDAPEGSLDAPAGSLDAPDGPFDAPDGPSNRPEDSAQVQPAAHGKASPPHELGQGSSEGSESETCGTEPGAAAPREGPGGVPALGQHPAAAEQQTSVSSSSSSSSPQREGHRVRRHRHPRPVRAEVALALFGLQGHEHLSEEATDTHCRLGWSEREVVLAFR